MITERPKVTSNGGKISFPNVLFKIPLCKTYPKTPIVGTTTIKLAMGCRFKLVETVNPKNAERIIKSPCAIFTNLITPKIKESPAAKRAYRPPTKIP